MCCHTQTDILSYPKPRCCWQWVILNGAEVCMWLKYNELCTGLPNAMLFLHYVGISIQLLVLPHCDTRRHQPPSSLWWCCARDPILFLISTQISWSLRFQPYNYVWVCVYVHKHACKCACACNKHSRSRMDRPSIRAPGKTALTMTTTSSRSIVCAYFQHWNEAVTCH